MLDAMFAVMTSKGMPHSVHAARVHRKTALHHQPVVMEGFTVGTCRDDELRDFNACVNTQLIPGDSQRHLLAQQSGQLLARFWLKEQRQSRNGDPAAKAGDC
jgi:hypothetical protein